MARECGPPSWVLLAYGDEGGCKMSDQNATDDIPDFDIDEFFRFVEELAAKKKLRQERPWTYDIIRVLWNSRSWISMDQLCESLWALRNPSGLPIPKKFKETVQSTLNHHTSQSVVFLKRDGKEEDDLFISPKGKHSGTWALRSREAAIAWLKRQSLTI